MYYVYILESLKDKSLYIGSTNDLHRRLSQHNSGQSRHTNQHRPYKRIAYIALPTKEDAERYEQYLKSGYGRKTINKMLQTYFAQIAANVERHSTKQ